MPPGSVRTLAAHAELLSVAEDLIREGQRSGIQTAAICRTLMELFLLKVTEAASWAGKGSPIARDNFLRCKSLIDAHAERLGGLADLSREAGMDVSSICRLFRRFQGASPYQYLLRRKMNLAAELLMDRGCLVKEAAQLVGFSDPFHFARCFKAVHGVPPSAVRDFSREV
jgi:AraC-like DNA-binding protein